MGLRKYKILDPTPFLLAILLSGCATTPPPKPAASASILPHRVTIDSVSYLPSGTLARQLRGHTTWDSESLIWVLRVGAHELRAAPGIAVLLVDGKPYPLQNPPITRDGELLLPEVVFTRWMASWPPGTAVPLPPVRGIPFRTIVLDPGHGGRDPGAISRLGLREKHVTLDVALRLQRLLEQEGFRVVMTRQTDRFVSLSSRSDIANRVQGNLFVSIHANASRSRAISGYEVYYLSEATDDHARALEAAENHLLPEEVGEPSHGTEAIVWDLLYTEYRKESRELAAAICQGIQRRRIPSINRGVKSARFAVLKGARMPSILVEVGFITHRGEEARLKDSGYRQAIAEGVKSGLLAFIRQNGRRT